MNGFSIFLGDLLDEEKIDYLYKMHRAGFKGIFTSLHIPEENTVFYLERLKELGKYAKKLDMKLMVDISGEALKKAGFSFDSLEDLVKIGVTGLRMDDNISSKMIAKASEILDIGLNASTITENDILELAAYNANFKKFEAWHNYYPRPETGLDELFFIEKNKWLHESGFKTFAFVPGNGQLRDPLKEGLPTLEKHRFEHPLAASIELKEDYFIDSVYIGDPRIDERTIAQFQFYDEEDSLLIEVEATQSEYHSLVLGDHVNRQDVAKDVVRSAEARVKKIPNIKVEEQYSLERTMGSVTIDNELYGRYMGEVQITKCDLDSDPKVTVVANVSQKDQALISKIHAGKKFKLIERGTIENEFRKFNN